LNFTLYRRWLLDGRNESRTVVDMAKQRAFSHQH